MQDGMLNSFRLVGGTALSLQLGHRKSLDIDLFYDCDFDAELLSYHIKNDYKADEI
jgi:hypothetical protein